ncbi:MAG: GNAT family N-acetyltransferase [Actinomadura rubrobrunea]|nr:GNAT family N-acetyltransferase [Actinomadura rubrobrunea]
MVKIRTFTERDRPVLQALFTRARKGSPSDSLWGHDESEAAVYLRPYMDLEPGSLLLAIDGARVIGYLAGCLDSAAFPSEVARVDQAIRRYRPFLRPRSAGFFARGLVDVAWAALRRAPVAGDFHDPRWPAHLHINVVPEARGSGAADRLMDHWLERVTDHGVAGCHLQTVAENTRAVRFFKRKGFVAHGPARVIPGLRYKGRRVHQRTMVWNP